MKLPNIDKNAYLSVFLNNQTIYANLAYVDYTSGRNYILSDITQVDDKEVVYSFDFWNEYFDCIREKFNWEIFREKNIIPITAEGIGLGALTVHISGHHYDVDKILGFLREVSFQIKFKVVTSDYIRRLMDGVSSKVGYEDIVYINLDLFDFDIFRFKAIGENRNLSQPLNQNGIFEDASIRWLKKENLIENISNTKLKAFMSHEVNAQKLSNLWANFVLKPSYVKNNTILQDLIRSYITVQLLSILNENQNKFTQIGATSNTTLLILSGTLLSILDPQELYLSLIDGLELGGELDVLIDNKGQFLTFGRNMVEGIESEEYVVSINDIMNKVKKIVLANVKTAGKRKVIFSGKLESSSHGEKEIYAFSPEITVVPLNNKKEFVTGKFIQGAFWGDKYETFELYSDERTVTYSELIIDGRTKPVVYGPDARTNRLKINGWINENS